VEVLVEGASKNNPDILSGRTRGNKLVHFRGPASLTGEFAQVKITDTQTWYLTGEWVESENKAETAAV
jgi:tRNA-2-methylthio-N6-dimethylallyladenosine synthase